MRKYVPKFVQRSKWDWVSYPSSHHPCIYVTKNEDIFDQKEVLIILITSRHIFNFSEKLVVGGPWVQSTATLQGNDAILVMVTGNARNIPGQR